jgi:hypothetical protein
VKRFAVTRASEFFRIAQPGECVRPLAPGGKLGEGSPLLPPVQVVQSGHLGILAGFGTDLRDDGQIVGLPERERSQHCGIQQAEQRRVGTDGERQDHDCESRNTRSSAE